MAINSYFFNAVKVGDEYDRVYDANDFTSYLNLLVGNGVFANPSTTLQVRASSGMDVIVGAGSGWINGLKMENTADLTLTVSAADSVLNRIDRVVFYADYTAREMGIDIIKGALAQNPQAPTLTRTASRYEMALADIYVAKLATSISASNITDRRQDSNLCGIVTGLIDQIDTTTLFTQFTSQFNEWFEDIKDQIKPKLLTQYAYTHTTAETSEDTFDVTTLIPEYSISTDILDVYISGLLLTEDEFTNTNGTVTLNVPITHTGTEVTFVVYSNGME
jgi:hypothetical protein